MEEDKEMLKKIIKDGGKITDTIITEKDKITTTRKIEPVKGKTTSSTIITSKDEINISF